jgi:hypothetical protein
MAGVKVEIGGEEHASQTTHCGPNLKSSKLAAKGAGSEKSVRGVRA